MKYNFMTRSTAFFVFLILIQLPVFGQTHQCSKANKTSRKLKSSTLLSKDLDRMEKYDLTYLLMDLNVSNTSTEIGGFVTHKGFFKNEIDSILFELHEDFSIDSILLNRKKTNFVRRETLLIIPNENANFVATIYYHGSKKTPQNQFMGGSGVVNGTDLYYNSQFKVSYTQSEPFSAYEWWPSKQSLNDKIEQADLIFTSDSTNLVGSNGILIKKENIGNGKVKFHWQTKYPTNYYLFSFSVAPYLDYSFKTYIPEAQDSILIQNFIYNTPTVLKYEKENIHLTGDYLKFYSKIYGIYPFIKEKYGHCLTTLGGGMEHQTMTTLYSFDKRLVAHELAHQWWGDYVTCKSYQDIWLNEGFATYSEYLMTEQLFPELKNSLLSEIQSSALTMKSGSVWVMDTTNENRIFNRELTYDKGAAIIHTLRYIINNDSIFFKSLKNYQSEYAFSFASVPNFKKSIEKSCNLDLTNFFNEWYYGEGYPIYSFKSEKTDSLRIYINQTTTSSKTPLFTTPLIVSIGRINLPDTLIRLNITQNKNVFAFDTILNFGNINTVDPQNYILNGISKFLSVTDLMDGYVEIYPNPAKNNLHILTKQPNQYTIRIYDQQGKIIIEKQHIDESILSLENINSGLYIIEIKTDTSFITEKLILE
jgi:aminopeptidase N